jgi:glycosyltransferase involved in cell wall biosynthesis
MEADILHLHWTAGFLSTRSLHEIADLGKPVCWTLHDLRPLTGGCHFPAGCENYRGLCDPCPQLERDPLGFARNGQAAQGRALARLQPHFVAPSRWLTDAAAASRVATGLKVSHIPYGVDLARFAPGEKAEARRRLGLDASARYVMLGAHTFEELRKGTTQAAEILRHLAGDPQVASGGWRLVCAGAKPPGELGGWPVTAMGHLAPDEMALLYVAADVLLFTSQEDNLPNILLEAAAAGLPVVALDAGGVRDIVRNEVTGTLAPLSDLSGAAHGVRELLENAELARRYGAAERRLMEAEFAPERQASAYIALYRELSGGPRKDLMRTGNRAEAAEGAPELALTWSQKQARAEADALREHIANLSAALETTRGQVESLRNALEQKQKDLDDTWAAAQDFREKYVAAHERAEAAEQRYWREREKPLRQHVREALLGRKD